MSTTIEKQFNAVFSKKYNSVSAIAYPESYFNIHLLSTQYPEIPKSKVGEETGYAKFKFEFKMFNYKKDNTLFESGVLGNAQLKEPSITQKYDGAIYPVLSFPIYFPLYNKKVCFDEKNVLDLSFLFLESLSVYYQQYVASTNQFVNMPHIYMLNKDYLAKKSIDMISDSINNYNLFNKIEKEVKAISSTDGFLNFDMNTLPVEFDIEEFISLPTNIAPLQQVDEDFLNNESVNSQYMHRFIYTVSKMFRV